MRSADEIKRNARGAGLLYLALSILAMISYFYIRPRLVIPEDAAATARNILANEQLYRASILMDVVVQLLFVFVALALYRLFQDVDRSQARLMVALVGTGIAAQFAGFVFNVAPLIFLSGDDYLSAFTRPQLEALAHASLSLGAKLGELLTSLWGVWLFPFAALTMKSGFLPKFLGVLLILSGIAYVVTCVTAIMAPDRVDSISGLLFPFYFGELIVVLWLALVGAKPRTIEAQTATPM
jgi:Domain of unknown function (DUF4386)